jgi:hypothetical protein
MRLRFDSVPRQRGEMAVLRTTENRSEKRTRSSLELVVVGMFGINGRLWHHLIFQSWVASDGDMVSYNSPI